jgi:Zn-dependent protease
VNWSPSIGTIAGIRIEIHIIFMIFVAIELLRAGSRVGFMWTSTYMVILFLTVPLHEFGHCFGARYVGGSANRILMWPLGGLAYCQTPHRPGAHFFVAAAGPLVNVGICLICGALLILFAGSLSAVPLNPFRFDFPVELLRSRVNVYVLYYTYQIYMISYVLLLFNVCLPFYPMDGGRLLQAVLWWKMGYGRSMQIATTIGMAGAVVAGCYGLFTGEFILIGIAVFGYIACYQAKRAGFEAGATVIEEDYDLSAARVNPHAETKKKRGRFGQGSWERKQKQLAEEAAEVDRILQKVSDQGIASLTRREKKVLAQATKRQQAEERDLGRL